MRGQILLELYIGTTLTISALEPVSAGPLSGLIERDGEQSLVRSLRPMPGEASGFDALMNRDVDTSISNELRSIHRADLIPGFERAVRHSASPEIHEFATRDVDIWRAIEETKSNSDNLSPLKDDRVEGIAFQLLHDSIDSMSLDAFSSQSRLTDAINKEIKQRAEQEAKNPEPQYIFEIASGKLTVPWKKNIGNLQIKPGEINVYKVTAAFVGIIMCGSLGCVGKATKALFSENSNGNKDDTPGKKQEELRRAERNSSATSDPLHRFVSSTPSQNQ